MVSHPTPWTCSSRRIISQRLPRAAQATKYFCVQTGGKKGVNVIVVRAWRQPTFTGHPGSIRQVYVIDIHAGHRRTFISIGQPTFGPFHPPRLVNSCQQPSHRQRVNIVRTLMDSANLQHGIQGTSGAKRRGGNNQNRRQQKTTIGRHGYEAISLISRLRTDRRCRIFSWQRQNSDDVKLASVRQRKTSAEFHVYL